MEEFLPPAPCRPRVSCSDSKWRFSEAIWDRSPGTLASAMPGTQPPPAGDEPVASQTASGAKGPSRLAGSKTRKSCPFSKAEISFRKAWSGHAEDINPGISISSDQDSRRPLWLLCFRLTNRTARSGDSAKGRSLGLRRAMGFMSMTIPVSLGGKRTIRVRASHL